MKYGFGVDLGGTTVKIAWFREDGTLLDKWEIPTVTENAGKRILPDIANSLLTYLKENNIPKTDVLGIGIGVPGPVRPDGTVNKCINLGWGVLNIEKELGALTDLSVKAGNDATVASLGEYWKGGGAGCQNMVFITLGTGVGGGVIVEGKAILGAHGAGGEIGHMVLNPKETEPCNCGKKGCVEQYCSATGIVRLAKSYLAETGCASSLLERPDFTCKDVFDAAKAKDVAAEKILQQVYDYLGQFLANVCNVVDPEAVVLGGGVSKAGQSLLEGVEKAFCQYVFHAVHPVKFLLATLGNDAGAYGAFRLILDKE